MRHKKDYSHIMLKLHNTLSRGIQEFKSIEPYAVRLYTCGPTVYNSLTIGNWVAYIAWDILVRTLKANGYEVDRVMNITDVGHLVSDADEGEDKLQKGAKREGKTAWEVAAFYTKDFMDGMAKLNLIAPTHLTKATDFIDEQLTLIRALKEKGYTYRIDDGIYFDTSKFPTYANFARLDLESLKAGARIEYNTEKRNPSDFALWKFSPAAEQRDMEWETPTDLLEEGEHKKGFPGWHIECSAMAMSLLGNTLDIHTGGIDHIPVHHTNEIAQSEAASSVRFSNYWLHNNHLKVDGVKISKSLGNGYTLEDLEERGYTPLEYRLFVLQSHYRSEGNFTFENLDGAKNRLAHWRSIAALRHQIHATLEPDDVRESSIYGASRALLEALDDDLNTPEALKVIDHAFHEIEQRSINRIHRHSLITLLESIDELLGVELISSTPDITDEQKQRIIQRERAREQKDWQISDEIRVSFESEGIILKDTSHGTIWSYN